MIAPSGRRRKSKSTSCNWCRRRKIKCDRTYPCSSCVRFQQTCEYENVPLADEKQSEDIEVQQQLRFLKAKLDLLEATLSNESSDTASGLNYVDFITSEYSHLPQTTSPSDVTAKEVTLDNWKQFLQARGSLHDEEADDEEFCIYDQYESVCDAGNERRFYGPFTWAAFLAGDMFVTRVNKLWRTMAFDAYDRILTSDSAMERYFLQRFQWISGEEAFVTVKDEVNKAIEDKKSKSNRAHKNSGILFHETEIDNDLELVNKIKLVFPNQKTIWMLLDRYFSLMYPMLPFLDESSFRSVIVRLLRGRRMVAEKVAWLNVVTKLDFAYLGMLLIILRLSFLSLFTNFNDINETMIKSEPDENIRYLMNNTVSVDCIILAEACLNQFNLIKSVNITLIQFALFYKAYYFYGPEFCDPLDDTGGSSINTVLMDMAYSVGLHRDPTNFANFNEREANLARKLWYHICCFDLMTSLAAGVPSHLSKYFVDVREPDIITEKQHFNNNDPTMNRLADVLLLRNAEVFQMMKYFHRQVLDVNGKFKIEQMNKLCDAIKDILVTEDPTYEAFTRSLDAQKCDFYTKTFELKALFELVYSYMGINYHFFTYLSKKGDYDKAMKYLLKIFGLVFDTTFPLLLDFFSGKKRELQGLSEMIVNPSIQVLVTRTRLFLFMVLVRVRVFKTKFPLLFPSLSELEALLNKTSTIYVNINHLLSKRYYYSWKTSNFNAGISKLVDTIDFNDLYSDHDFSQPYGFTQLNIDRLNAILSDALSKAQNSNLVNQAVNPAASENDELWKMVRSLTKKNREEVFDPFEFFLQPCFADIEEV